MRKGTKRNSYFLVLKENKNTRKKKTSFEVTEPIRLCSYWIILDLVQLNITSQKNKFSIKDFFSKCDQIHGKLRVWSHLLKKSLMENSIFCAVLQRAYWLNFSLCLSELTIFCNTLIQRSELTNASFIATLYVTPIQLPELVTPAIWSTFHFTLEQANCRSRLLLLPGLHVIL